MKTLFSTVEQTWASVSSVTVHVAMAAGVLLNTKTSSPVSGSTGFNNIYIPPEDNSVGIVTAGPLHRVQIQSKKSPQP